MYLILFNNLSAQDTLNKSYELRVASYELSQEEEQNRDSVIVIVKKKKWAAALLAFPLFGITGAHRVYLGTIPIMPLAYMATLGGFGILPLIDFIVILATPKDKLDEFYENGKVFMWGK